MEPAVSYQPTDENRLSPDGRQGHDELNLAEFPLVLLAKRPPAGLHTIEYQDHDRHPLTGAPVLRKVTITGAGKYGLPTIHDEDVLMAMIYLTVADKSKNGFNDPTVRFGRRQLLQLLGWPDTGDYYNRLKQSIRRWKGVTIVYENWWDHLANEYIAEAGFSLLDNYKFSDGRRNDQSQLRLPLDDSHPQRSLCSITWNKTPFSSFKNGYLTTLDLDKLFSLPTAAAKRAYRYLNPRLPASGTQEFDLQAFACQHVGFSTSYKPSRLRSEVQKAIVGPLEENDFIEPMPSKSRFLKQNGQDRIVFSRKASPALSPADPAATVLPPVECLPVSMPSPLIGELTRRHLGGKLAAKFVADYPADHIRQKIDYLDFTLTTQSVKNPGGWLRKAIEEDFGPPPGFLPQAERQQQAQAKHQAEQKTAEARRRQKAEEARDRETRRKVDTYLKQLDQAARIALETEVLAAASPSDRESYESDAMALFRETLMLGMLRDYLAGKPELELIAVEA
jgi:hypothetical protein